MITDNLEVEIPVVVGEDGVTTIQLLTADITQLNIVKDEFGKTYLSGTVILTGIYFDLILQQRVNRSITQLLVRYADYEGLMNTNGLYHYDTGVCELSVGDTETFDSIINLEFKPENGITQFDYDTYLYSEYGTTGLSLSGEIYEDYANCGNEDPNTWNSTTIYGAANNLGGGKYAGDLDRFVFLSGRLYASLQDNNLGNNPATTTGYWAEISDVIKYSQERSVFNFEGSEYDANFKYYYKANCLTHSYTSDVYSVNIKNVLSLELNRYGFSLASDWLDYPKSINSLYESNLHLGSTEVIKKTSIYELIEAIQQAFDCVYIVTNKELKFIWKGERYSNWDNSLPNEHNLINIDIFDWSNSEDRNVKRHILKFTESDLGTHNNSIIEYENNYIEESSVEPSFDVDFAYSYNEEDTLCLFTTSDVDNKVSNDDGLFNNFLVPSFLHETFYFVDREFNTGVFNGNSVTLQLGYFETADRELQGSYNIENWNMEYQILINSLALAEQFAICEEVTYSIENNNYTLKLKTKN